MTSKAKKWEQIPLAELVEKGRSPTDQDDDTVVWNLNQIEADTGRILQKVRAPISELGSSTYPFEANTVLYSKLRPYLNKVVVPDENGWATTELVPLKCKPKVSPHFLAYYLRGQEFLSFANATVAGAKMPRMVMEKFWEYEISLPPLPEQKRIAAILDSADAIRQKRKTAIAKLDDLAQSVFLEIFGDESHAKYPMGSIGDYSKKLTDGTHQSPKFTAEGIPFLFVSNIVNNEITYQTAKFISESEYRELNKRTPIELGDILFTTVGSYGNGAMVKTDTKFSFQRHIAYIKPDRKFIEPYYLFGAMKSIDVNRQVERAVKGVAQKTLNLSDLSSIKIPIPPMNTHAPAGARRRGRAAGRAAVLFQSTRPRGARQFVF